jgi:probable addiction module antidote protein
VPFNAAHYLSANDLPGFLSEALNDGDYRALPLALRTAADVLGGMTVLAEKTGLSRETLYRTLSAKGNPRLDTLGAILAAFGLRIAVAPQRTAKPASKMRRAGVPV